MQLHPFGQIAVGGGILLLLIAIFWYFPLSWIVLALLLGLLILAWRLPASQLRAALQTASEAISIQPLYGIAVGILLTAIYGGAVWAGYAYGTQRLIKEFGVPYRTAWLIVTLLGLPMIPALWRLYAATGIPGDPRVISRGIQRVMLFLLIFFAWSQYAMPNRFFDPRTGESRFSVTPDGEIYHSTEIKHSPKTGDPLRPGTKEDALKRVAQDERKPWIEYLIPPITLTCTENYRVSWVGRFFGSETVLVPYTADGCTTGWVLPPDHGMLIGSDPDEPVTRRILCSDGTEQDPGGKFGEIIRRCRIRGVRYQTPVSVSDGKPPIRVRILVFRS